MALPLPLLVATQNPDKAREIAEIFATVAHEPLESRGIEGMAFLLDTPAHIDAAVAALAVPAVAPDVEETGATLEENARIKAAAVAEAFGVPAVADDTGLEIDELHGAPGVYSARYAGESATYADNVAKVLRELEGVYPADRTARFATVAMACRPGGGEIVARGEVEGLIAPAPRGESGFGYDPVFVPVEGDGRTFAEMRPEEKHAVSHRGRAFRALAVVLSEED